MRIGRKEMGEELISGQPGLQVGRGSPPSPLEMEMHSCTHSRIPSALPERWHATVNNTAKVPPS